MNCRRVQDLLSDYHDRLLPPRDAAAVTAHLGACPDCTRLHAALAAIEARARATGEWQPAAPPDLGRRAVDRWSAERDARITGGGPLWAGASGRTRGAAPATSRRAPTSPSWETPGLPPLPTARARSGALKSGREKAAAYIPRARRSASARGKPA